MAKFTESAVENGSNFEKLQKITKKFKMSQKSKNLKIGEKLEKYQILSIFSISMDFLSCMINIDQFMAF